MSSPVSTTPLESPSPSMSLMAQSLSKSLGSSSINAMVASLPSSLQIETLKRKHALPLLSLSYSPISIHTRPSISPLEESVDILLVEGNFEEAMD
ncbi:hypothetical protein P8452_69969 [Trifolium repens]|nr:hypothetical protein P8452_69969 [Trifolium repens]